MSHEREKIPVLRERRAKDAKQLTMVVDHAYLDGAYACFICGRSRAEHVA